MNSQAMILAAGRGERMRPLTDTCPKPLLPLKGKPLMGYHLDAFAHGGFRDVVVNTAWLGEQIEDHYGHETPEGVRIVYSHEGKDFGGALETAGGKLAHLFLVPNPEHNPKGDFGLGDDGLALNQAEVRYTYSTTALFRRAFFDGLPAGNPQGLKVALAPLLRQAMDRGQVSAEL